MIQRFDTSNIDDDNSFMDIYKVFKEINPIDEDNDSKMGIKIRIK